MFNNLPIPSRLPQSLAAVPAISLATAWSVVFARPSELEIYRLAWAAAQAQLAARDRAPEVTDSSYLWN